MKRLAVLVAAVLAITTAAYAMPLYDVNTDAALSQTVLFIGDSNIQRGAAQITFALTRRASGYLPILTPRNGMGLRGYVPTYCPAALPCDASSYWQIRLAQVLAAVHPDAIVINLGINDATIAGTATSTGYSSYPQKIDWLLGQLPDVPTFWSMLPCSITPAVGCGTIDYAITVAPSRHPNLTVLPWNVTAYGHTEWVADLPHLNAAGYTAWSNLVVQALDARFP